MIQEFRMYLYNIINKCSSGESIKSKVARGGFWLGAASSTEQILRLIRNMILARLLAPEAFGLMGIAMSINAAFESFTQLGISQAIIQNQRGKEQSYLNGAWWLSCGRAFVIYGIVWVSSPWISDFYDSHELLPLMRVVFLSVLFNGMTSARAYVAIKEMKFKKWVIVLHGGAICGILSAILLVLFIPNVWALVLGYTIEAAACCILSFIICPFIPKLAFDRENIRALLKFSRGMFGLPILVFLYMNADIFVIGKILTLADLGLYSMAAGIAWMPFNFITSLIGQVMLPAFSEKQKDGEWINKWTLNITALITFIFSPLLFIVILYGKEILTLIYGINYGNVSIPFAIIFASAFMRIVGVPIVIVYTAIGRPELHRLFTGVRTIVMISLIWPAVQFYGLIGAAFAGLISMVIGNIFQAARINKIIRLPIWHYFKIFLFALLFSFIVVLFWFISFCFALSNPVVKISIGILGCLTSYAAMAYCVINKRGHWRGVLSDII
jgi:O-antigen/teichoic acid export membrane protein